MRQPFEVELWKPVDDSRISSLLRRVSRLPRKPITKLSLTYDWAKSYACGMPSERCCFLPTRMSKPRCSSAWTVEKLAVLWIPASRLHECDTRVSETLAHLGPVTPALPLFGFRS